MLEHRQRLDQQLKTVIAPREAEALMHEIARIEAQRDELDVAELEALEQQAELDDQLAAHLASRRPNRGGVASSRTTHWRRRWPRSMPSSSGSLRPGVEPLVEDGRSISLLATYDRKRAAFGVAVAALVGRQCQGCHLELSAAEIDTVKDEAAATGVTDCPDCGRLLIV